MCLLGSIFNLFGLARYGLCVSPDLALIWLRSGSNALILASYVSIPMSLAWLLRRRRDRTHPVVACLFVTFFLAEAALHGLSIMMPWVPDRGWDGLATAVTAVISVATAATLWILAPRLASMLSPAQLTNLNTELSSTISKQKATLHKLLGIEQKLRNSNSRLEKNVGKYAADLRISNARLLDLFAKRVATQALLAKSEAEYRASFEAGIGKVQMEPLTGRLLRVNGAFAGIVGYVAKELIGRDIWNFVHPDDRAAAVGAFNKLLAGETGACMIEARYLRGDGVLAWVQMSATVVLDPAVGLPRLALAEIENIDLRRGAQAALRASDILLRVALECGPSGVWVFDVHNGLFWTDPRASAMTGGTVPAETWLALAGSEYAAWAKRIHPADRDQREAQLQSLFSGRAERVVTEYRVRNGQGGWSVLSNRCVVMEHDAATGLPARAAGAVTDVTGRAAALTEARTARENLEQDLQKRGAVLAQRHLLLREVYHRMNDTLEIADRLFAASSQVTDGDLREALSDQRGRICALGFVHGELMTPVDVETFDVAPFLHELSDAIVANTLHREVAVEVDADHLEVVLAHVIPLGLLVTELLNNCLRHAAATGTGRIYIGMKAGAGMEMTLIVSADRVASGPAERPSAFMAGLETRFVRDLVSQLRAELDVRIENGLTIEVAIAS
jgi:PAS domain S-box-containing protein